MAVWEIKPGQNSVKIYNGKKIRLYRITLGIGADSVWVRPLLAKLNGNWEIHRRSSFDVEGDYIVVKYSTDNSKKAPRRIKGTYELID